MEEKRMFRIAPYKIDLIRPFTVKRDAETKQITQEGGEMVRPFVIGKAPVQMETLEPRVCGLSTLPKQSAKDMVERPKEDETKKAINTEEAPVSNYRLIPVRRIIFIDREGREKEELERIRTRVEIVGGSSREVDIPVSEIWNITRFIGKRFHGAIINYEEPKAEKKIEVDYRMRTRDIPTLTYYVEAGWQMIGGRYVYLHDSVVLEKGCKVDTRKNLPTDCVSYIEVGNILNAALSLYKEGITRSTLFLYSFSGITYRLFSEAGYPPHFLLFISGKTGTMKTTIAKILFTQLCNDKYRENPRRIDADTLTSFERAIVKNGVDTITLIDDYCPAKTALKKGDMINKLEAIVRMVGDGSTKSRSNANLDDVQGEGIQGTVVLTGEIRGKGLSSNLRCFYCELEQGKANMDVVTWFQENRRAYTTLIGVFAEFLSQNWNRAVEHIKQQFPIKRKVIEKEIEKRRVVDSVVALQLIAEIVECFCVEYCKFEEKVAHDMFEHMKRDIMANGKYSQDISEEESPALTFVRAIRDMILTKKIILCEKSSFVVGEGWDGFEDGNFLFFVPENTYSKVHEFLATTGYFLPLDLREIVISLHEEGFVKTYPNGDGKRVYYSRVPFNGKKHKFLQLSKSVFDNLADEKF